jgi:Arylsulfotransferase (ASST)/Secretion system C-terminal sorting domain
MKSILSSLLLFLVFVSAKAQRWEGLTLVGNQMNSTLKLIDTTGTTFKTITCTGGNTGYSTYMMPGGFFWRSVKKTTIIGGGGVTGGIQKLDWNGNVLFDYTLNTATNVIHHDFCPLPNGNFLVIAYEVLPAGAVTAAGGTFAASVQSEKIMEIQPTGATTSNVVWEWKLWDHICQSTDAAKPNYVTSIVNNPQLLNVATITNKDFCHMNGIDYDSVNNRIIFSSHFLNEIYIIDHSTTTAQAAAHVGGNSGKGGDLLYRWGRTSNYGAGSTGDIINVIHDGHLVKQGPMKGALGFFHNKGVGGSTSSADYITPPLAGSNYTITAGQAYAPSTYLKHVVPGLSSNNMGSTEEFPNGNVMVCSALQGTFKELDSNGNTLWSYNMGGNIAQVHRYANCELSIIKPSALAITAAGTNLSTTTVPGGTFEWYLNGAVIAGANINTYNAGANNGVYTAIVKDSFGCKSPISNAIGIYPESILNINVYQLSIYPNPVTNVLNILGTEKLNNFTIDVIDITGKKIMTINNAKTINTANLNAGIYFVNIYQNNKVVFNTSFNRK